MRTICYQRNGFTLRDMLWGVTAIGLMLLLALPVIRASQEKARQNVCINNLKQLLLSMHNYHADHKRFPHLTSTQIRGTKPAAVGADGTPHAGYSWHVALLPYLAQQKLYDEIDRQSKNFGLPAFDSQVVPFKTNSASAAPGFAANQVVHHRCSMQGRGKFANAPEYSALGPNLVAAGNYVAMAATHLDCLIGNPDQPEHVPPNGVLVPGPTVVRFKDVRDGTSRTIALVETREPNYTSWYDGTVGWVVAADPNQPAPTRNETTGFLETAYATALTTGTSTAATTVAYLPAKLHGSIAQDWRYGPSSEHAGGLVMHGICDGSVRSFTGDTDGTLYLQLVTRAGEEPLSTCCTGDCCGD